MTSCLTENYTGKTFIERQYYIKMEESYL